MTATLSVRTPLLDITYLAYGPSDGPPVVLLHGFPYAPNSYAEVAPLLADASCRVLVPFLRGYGPTRFLSPETVRSGQQAALGRDLLDFLDALGIPHAVVAGYDWGGRAACILAALWPARVRGLVTCGGYTIQDIAGSARPAAPEFERRLWYQYYFNTERGRAGLTANRYDLGRLLWQLWSPSWQFSESDYAEAAGAFENADFVDVAIHSYRHRYGYARGDPGYDAMEAQLAEQPTIRVPTIALNGLDDGVSALPSPDSDRRYFVGSFERRDLAGVGHNPPQERPSDVVAAVLDLVHQ